jgi:hypothetical protein
MNPHNYTHLIFDKVTKDIQWRKYSLFNKFCWEKWLSACKKTESRFMLITLYYYQLKMVKDLSIRPENLKLVQERAGNTLEAIGIGKDFFNKTSAAQ